MSNNNINRPPSVISVDPEAQPDVQYLAQYKEGKAKNDRVKSMGKNLILGEAGLEVKAFLGLQHLVVTRYEQKLYHLNEKVFREQHLLEGKELEEVEATLHQYCMHILTICYPIRSTTRPRNPNQISRRSPIRPRKHTPTTLPPNNRHEQESAQEPGKRAKISSERRY